MSNILRTGLWPVLLDILFPIRCLGCNAGLQGRQVIAFCQVCLDDIRMIREPYCTRCGRPFEKSGGESHLCSQCLTVGWHFNRARAVVYYRGPIAEAVKLFKYNGKMHCLETLRAMTRNAYSADSLLPYDVIIPVPLHIKRLRQRGFNQALVMARKFFPENRDVIDPHILERKIWIRPQTGLRGAERRKNVRNVFSVNNPGKIKNKKVLVVDDVFTTGATVNECSRILAKKGAGEIDIFTFARSID